MGTAWAEAGDWTVCAVSGNRGVIGGGHSLGHVGWGRSGKRIQVHTKGPPGLTLVVDLDPSRSIEFCLYIAKRLGFGLRPQDMGHLGQLTLLSAPECPHQ